MFELLYEVAQSDPLEVVTLTARQNGRQNFMGFGCRKNEFDVRGRLFQRFQQGIEGGIREHMDFVNNDHPKTALGRSVLHPFGQIANIVHPGMRGTVDFQDINGAAVRDLLTLATGVTGVWRRPLFTVQGFGQEAGRWLFSPLRAAR